MDDTQYQFNLEYCGKTIRMWKRLYFKKNSRIRSKIVLRFVAPIADERTFKWFLELHRNGKMVQQDRIKQEAYDTLSYGLKKEDYNDVCFCTYAEHVPAEAAK